MTQETALQAQIRVTIEKARINLANAEAAYAEIKTANRKLWDDLAAAAPVEFKAWSESCRPEYRAKATVQEARNALAQAEKLSKIEVAS